MSEKIPLSPAFATCRVGTTDSTASSYAIPPESGDVGGLLVERLRAWKHAVGYLEAYVTQTESAHRALSKEYGKVLKTVDEPLREGHHFSQNVGGIASFFESARANTGRLSASHNEVAAELKSTVVPALGRLHKEIRDRQKHVQAECERSAKAVQKARNNTQGHIKLLSQHSAALDSLAGASTSPAGTKLKPENDPFLLKKGVVNRLAKQVLEENAQRQELMGVQEHTQQFEAHIVQTTQQALAALHHTLVSQTEVQRHLYGDILEKWNVIPLDYEWVNFLTRNAETLIDPSAPKRTVDSIRYANEDHASTAPLVEGALSRKGKIMRSYNSAYYVVTPSKYLHEFKDRDSLTRTPTPELSLYLPDCTISALSKDGKFQVSGKDAGSSLKGLNQKHEFAFKAGSYAEGQRWYDAISRGVGSGIKSDVTPVASPVSPVYDKGHPPAYEAPGELVSTPSPAGQETGQVTGITTVVTAGPPVEKSA